MRPIEIFFIKDYKDYVELYGKKSKSEYVLNVNKLIREKLQTDFVVPNKTQAFLLNYEIRKLIDKVINIKNKKYTRLVYQNCNLSLSGVRNTLEFLQLTYPGINFDASILDPESEFVESDGIKIIKAEA